jgi:hypothetical protein
VAHRARAGVRCGRYRRRGCQQRGLFDDEGHEPEASREDWIASLDKVAGLQPRIVIAGHKSVGASDDPTCVTATQQYLRDFTRIVHAQEMAEDIVAAMLELHATVTTPAFSGTPPARLSRSAADRIET